MKKLRLKRTRGQSLVEFALILPILLLVLVGILEGGRLVFIWISVQHAARTAARYAISGQPLDINGELWQLDAFYPPQHSSNPEDSRVFHIQNVAIAASSWTGYSKILTKTNLAASELDFGKCFDITQSTIDYPGIAFNEECSGVLGIQVEGCCQLVGFQEKMVPNFAGVPGTDVRVTVYQQVKFMLPFYESLGSLAFRNKPILVSASVKMKNEGIGSASQAQELIDDIGGICPNPPCYASPTPPHTPIPKCHITIDSDGNGGDDCNCYYFKGETISAELVNCNQNESYDIYIKNASQENTVESVVVSSNPQPFTIDVTAPPLPNPILICAPYYIDARQNNDVKADPVQFNICEAPEPFIVVQDDQVYFPYGSTVKYSLVGHLSLTDYTLALDSTLSDANFIPSTTQTDDAGGATGLEIETERLVNPPSDDFVLESTQTDNGTTAATYDLEFGHACIRVDRTAGSCGSETQDPPVIAVTVPENSSISLRLEKHAYDSDYSVESNIPGASVRTSTTNGAGTGVLDSPPTYAIPDGTPNGTYEISTKDMDDNIIAVVRIAVDTPSNAYIYVKNGTTHAAGTMLNLQLRNHPDGEYNIFWRNTKQNNLSPTSTIGPDVNYPFNFTIPSDTPVGTYRLASKLVGSNDETAGVDIEVTVTNGNIEIYENSGDPNPLHVDKGGLDIAQIPGSPITVKINNHNPYETYQIYASGSGMTTTLLLGHVYADATGAGAVNTYIPNTIYQDMSIDVASYPIGVSPAQGAPFATVEQQVALVDLIVTNIDMPTDPPFNEYFPITLTVKNDSDVSIPSHLTFDVDVYVDPPLAPDLGSYLPPGNIKRWHMNGLASQASTTMTAPVVLLGATEHKIYARVDTSQRVIEGSPAEADSGSSNEFNNIISTTVLLDECSEEITSADDEGWVIESFGNAEHEGYYTYQMTNSLQIATLGGWTSARNDDTQNFNGSNDSGYTYAYRNFSGNFEVQALVGSNDPGSDGLGFYSKWGIEIRDSAAGNAKKLQWAFYDRFQRIQILYRHGNSVCYTLGDKSFPPTPGTIAQPAWIRVIRNGGKFELYYMPGGSSHWLQADVTGWDSGNCGLTNGAVNDTMSGNVLVGVFATTYKDNAPPNTFEEYKFYDFTKFHICTAGTGCTSGNVLYGVDYDSDNGVVDNGWNVIAYGSAKSASPPYSFMREVIRPYQAFTSTNNEVTMITNGQGVEATNDFGNDNGYVLSNISVTGDFDVRVQLTEQNDLEPVMYSNGNDLNISDKAVAGIELRATFEGNSDKVAWFAAHGSGLNYISRINGNTSLGSGGIGGGGLPVWLRMVRSGEKVSLSYSLENTDTPTDWKAVTNFDIELPSLAYFGFINASSDDFRRNTVKFENFHFCGNAGGGSRCGEVRETSGLVILDSTNHVNNLSGWETTYREGYVGMRPNAANSELHYDVDITNSGDYNVWLLGAKSAGYGHQPKIKFGKHGGALSECIIPVEMGQSTLGWFKCTTINVTQVSTKFMAKSGIDGFPGFELYQILLTTDPNYNPDVDGQTSQSQCTTALTLQNDIPPLLRDCENIVTDGNFEMSPTLSDWEYSSVLEGVVRIPDPHYRAPNEIYSLRMPATGGRRPWLEQVVSMPDWVLEPGPNNSGTHIDLTLKAGVDPQTAPQPDPLYVLLQNQGGVDLTGQLELTTGATEPYIDPNGEYVNNDWQSIGYRFTDYFQDTPAYAGQSLLLRFESPNLDNTYRSVFFLDNIYLNVCTAQPELPYTSKLHGRVDVFFSGIGNVPKAGVFVWAYAVNGEMQKTYTIHDATYNFYDFPAGDYIVYSEYFEGVGLYVASDEVTLPESGEVELNLTLR